MVEHARTEAQAASGGRPRRAERGADQQPFEPERLPRRTNVATILTAPSLPGARDAH